ncbi:hypothetical protein RB594_008457 [Gaeumannomyces avenae]
MPSRILLRNVVIAGAAARPATTITRRAIATSPQLPHKESSLNTSDDVARHKDDLLSKQKQGKGHWKPELASNSEEAVKADREATKEDAVKDRPSDYFKRLQERTKHAAEQNSKSGTSMGDGL